MKTGNKAQMGRVLVVAGSDSGGGAGIQADIKAIMAGRAHAMTAVTAITVQDTTGVHGVWPVPAEAIRGQMQVCLSDISADAVKTGMLASAGTVALVAEVLDAHAPGVARVIDPVLVASSGDRLTDDKAVQAYLSDLVPEAALVTPNAWEAEVLTGKAVDSVSGQRRAAEWLLERGAKGALVKGGHVAGDVITDVLQTEQGEWLFENPRIDAQTTHGSGCTLASATAAGIANGKKLDQAVEAAIAYLRGAISRAPGLGKGQGPMDHGWVVGDIARDIHPVTLDPGVRGPSSD